jgi:hypothetical protein
MVIDNDLEIIDAEIVDEKCQKRNSRGRQCKFKAIPGYFFCTRHLATATVSEIALVRKKDLGELTFEEITGRKVTNPLEELSLLVSEVILYKDFCADQVARLRGDYRYEGRSGEQLRAEVALYERSLDRVGKLLIEWSRLDIDERLTKIEEAKAAMLLEVIRRVLLSADLSDEQRSKAEASAVKELRALNR